MYKVCYVSVVDERFMRKTILSARWHRRRGLPAVLSSPLNLVGRNCRVRFPCYRKGRKGRQDVSVLIRLRRCSDSARVSTYVPRSWRYRLVDVVEVQAGLGKSLG
jgi:hypothetical protein